MITAEFDPNDRGVVDAFTSELYEMEAFNHYANGFAMQVLHHYYGEFDDNWYSIWIGTEEFRGGNLPGGQPMTPEQLKRYENMYDMYWDARAEWFNQMVAQLMAANLRELNRSMYLRTITNTQPWEEFGKAAQAAPRINHIELED